jgi:hypothetical protein
MKKLTTTDVNILGYLPGLTNIRIKISESIESIPLKNDVAGQVNVELGDIKILQKF